MEGCGVDASHPIVRLHAPGIADVDPVADPAGPHAPAQGDEAPAVDLARHRRLRAVLRAHQNAAVAMISRTALRRCAERLGLLDGDELVLESESELTILHDHVIYDHRERGRTAVDRHLAKLPPCDDDADDEAVVRAAMVGARLSVYRVVGVVPGLGVFVDDALRDGPAPFVVDENFSRSARPGMLLAGRLLPMGDYACTSGAAFPMSDETLGLLRALLAPVVVVAEAADGELARQLESELAVAVIAAGLEEGGGSRIQYRNSPPPRTAAGGGRGAVGMTANGIKRRPMAHNA